MPRLKCVRLLAAMSTVLSATNVLAQTTSPHTRPLPSTIRAPSSMPDFHEKPTAFALVLLVMTFPLYLVSFTLLIKRRHMYPIAGRGATLLIILCACLFIDELIVTALGFAYPTGVPCSLIVLADYLHALPLGTILILRGWILVFRIEIMNYLDERRWRQEKLGKTTLSITTCQSEIASKPRRPSVRVIAVQPNLEAISEDGGNKFSVVPSPSHNASAIDSTLPIISDADSTIPGFWYITHRRYIAWNFLRLVLSFVFAFWVTFLSVLLSSDIDNTLTERELHASGVLAPNESLRDEALFGALTIWNEPTCSKSFSVRAWCWRASLAFFILPPIAWMSWKIRIDGRRRKQRQQEKMEMTGEVIVKSNNTSTRSLDLDDTAAVKHELLLIVLISTIATTVTLPVKSYDEGLVPVCLYPISIGITIISIVSPLRISYALSKKLRENLGLRCDHSLNATHRLLYYSLDYILANPTSYSLLLSFLQKEHSSENILFLSAAEKFTTAARQLEAAANWPSKSKNTATLILDDFANPSSQTSPRTYRLAPLEAKNRRDNSIEIPSSSLPSLFLPKQQSIDVNDKSHLLAQALQLKAQYQLIQRDYLTKAAVYEVNLPQCVSALIQERHRQLDVWMLDDTLSPPPFPLSTLYREVYTEVYKLIERDSLRRFVLTPAFESLLARADEQEVNQLEHQVDLHDGTEQVVERAVEMLAVEGKKSVDLNANTEFMDRLRSSTESVLDDTTMQYSLNGMYSSAPVSNA